MLLPENALAERYEAEPFVLPADVCSAPGRIGCAGWTWYTGSAGWYFHAVCEGLLGLRLKEGKMQVRPGALGDYTVKWIDPKGEVRRIEVRDGKIV